MLEENRNVLNQAYVGLNFLFIVNGIRYSCPYYIFPQFEIKILL